jgi:hypothetical protein
MDRLLELLREYSTLIEERTEEYWNPIRWWNEKCLTYPIEIMRIKSKEYWFIERLVKNDKIKSDGIKPREDLVKEIQIVDFKTGKTLWWKNQYSETEQLIMYLSIQDNPLEYLCSILKE